MSFKSWLKETTALSKDFPPVDAESFHKFNTGYLQLAAAPPLQGDDHGIVISPPIVVQRAEGEPSFIHVHNGDLDLQELRFSLLFWDRLEFPKFNMVGMGITPDGEYLETEGKLQRSTFDCWWGEMGEMMIQAFVQTYMALEKRDPGRWSFGRGERSISFPGRELTPNRGILVELHQAVPIPHKDVPLHDILQFREKRRAERLRLRHELSRIYQAIESAPDRSLAKTTEFQALDLALTDHIRVSQESGIKMVLSGVQAKIDAKMLMEGFTAGSAVGGGTLTLASAEAALGAAALTVALSVGISAGLKRRTPSSTPYEYVSKFYRDLF